MPLAFPPVQIARKQIPSRHPPLQRTIISSPHASDKSAAGEDPGTTEQTDGIPSSQSAKAKTRPSKKEDLYEKCLLELQKFRISTPTAKRQSTTVSLKKDPEPHQKQPKLPIAQGCEMVHLKKEPELLREQDSLPICQRHGEKDASTKTLKDNTVQNLVHDLRRLSIIDPIEPSSSRTVLQVLTKQSTPAAQAKEKRPPTLLAHQAPNTKNSNAPPAAHENPDPHESKATNTPAPQRNSQGFTPAEMDILLHRVKVEYVEEEWRNKPSGPTELLSMENYRRYCEKLTRLCGLRSVGEREEEEVEEEEEEEEDWRDG